jgi:prepilin-type N-terminal cleavage/methylation domain-containing protein
VLINRRSGFSLIELMIAITIMAMMMAAIVPLMQQRPGYQRKEFVARLNALVQFGWQQAVITHQVHRVMFNAKDRTAFVERNAAKSTSGKLIFEPINDSLATTNWGSDIVIRQFIIEGFDEMKRFAGKNTETIWFYIVPNGMTQQVTINGVDKEDMVDGRGRQFGLVLNPFMAQFKEYDTFQK